MIDGLYIGLISGTSMDGVDAALVRFEQDHPINVIATQCLPYPDAVRMDLREAIEHPRNLSALQMARLDVRVGEVFGLAANALIARAGVAREAIRAVGSHGQTIFHAPDEQPPFSIQIGCPAMVAEKCGIDVVADFRAADLAAGGQAAPLAPAIHEAVLSSPDESRAIINIGGISNLTWLPGNQEDPVLGFDTGPGNCLMDDWITRYKSERFDANGDWAASGQVNSGLLERLLDDQYFSRPPPKSTGRETFDLDWLTSQLDGKLPAQDVQATLCELTARSIADAIEWTGPPQRLLICGGGVHNQALIGRLKAHFENIPVESTAAYGLEPDWVEAILLAWLARQHLSAQAGNIPAVTGARRPLVLGARYPAS
jgi:anhydro-N-acetylmuramic acid kinase